MAMFEQILFPSLVFLFFVVGISAAAIGVGLIICSPKVFDLFAVMNRSVSTRRATRSISVPRDIEPALLRHRKWLAAAIIVGASYSLYGLLAYSTPAALASAVSAAQGASYGTVHWIVEGVGWAMVAFSLMGLAVGILLAFFPATLSAVEQHANRWYSSRRATAPMEQTHLILDRWVERFPRTAGLAITVGALIVVISSGLMLFQ